jgi:hypothetical protein
MRIDSHARTRAPASFAQPYEAEPLWGSTKMAKRPSWNEEEPPKDRQVLALAFVKAFGSGSVNLVRVVAAWVESNQKWRPVVVGGDMIAETDLDVICWAELPDVPETVGRLKDSNPGWPMQVYPRPKSG